MSQPSFVVAIAGVSGAGKTTLVRRVAELLGDAAALHFDDYRPVANYPHYPAEMPQWIEAGRDLDAWEIPQLLDDLKALRGGQAITLPDHKDEVRPARFIVLEEPAGRERTGMGDVIDFVVWLDLPLEIALARKVVEAFDYWLHHIPPAELAQAVQRGVDYFSPYPLARAYYLTLIERVKPNCDLILDGTRATDALAQEIVAAVETNARNRALLIQTYAAFNARDVEAILAVMHPEVDWPNGMEGGRVYGHQGVRDYWRRQWALIDPRVEPRGFGIEADGRIGVDVQQVVRNLEGQVLSDRQVRHVYLIRDGLIMSMEIRG